MKKAVPKKNNKKKVCSDVENTNRCLLKSIELTEAFWCCTCISGSQGHWGLGSQEPPVPHFLGELA